MSARLQGKGIIGKKRWRRRYRAMGGLLAAAMQIGPLFANQSAYPAQGSFPLSPDNLRYCKICMPSLSHILK